MKYLISLLFLVAAPAIAEIPRQFQVVTHGTGSILDQTCRKLFAMYDSKYNAEAIVVAKPGQNGMVAVRDVLNSDRFSIRCGGSGDHVFNFFIHPEEAATLKRLRPVTITVRTPLYFFTGRAFAEARDLRQAIAQHKKLNRPIMIVGITSPQPRVIMDLIAEQEGIRIEYINFRNASDQIAMLADGTLDLAIDAGALMPLADTNKIRLLGYNEQSNITGIQAANVNQWYGTGHLTGFLSLSVGDRVPAATIQELNTRLVSLMRTDEFRQWAANRNVGVLATSLIETQSVIDRLYKATEKSWPKN